MADPGYDNLPPTVDLQQPRVDPGQGLLGPLGGSEGFSHAELVAALREDQFKRWREGERKLVEGYLEQQPALKAQDEVVLALLYSEIVLRENRQETPQLQEYVQRFPQFEAQLRHQFDARRSQEATFTQAPVQPRTVNAEVDTIAMPEQPAEVEAPTAPGYEMLSVLGHGGMGVVYKARQVRLNRIVALKMIRSGDRAGARELARFHVEAEAVAGLCHPNIVRIYDFGEQNGRPYFSMELVDGGSLAKKLDGKPLPPREAAELAQTLARAVHYVHQRQILHRDLKPANVLLTPDGIPKIADFGLAKRLDVDMKITATHAVLGTASYMAPEQAEGKTKNVGPAADIYALGAILYESLAGRPPFKAATRELTLCYVLCSDPVPPSQLQAEVPPELEAICLKCLQKRPEQRYASAEALAEDLRRFLAGEPISN